MGNKVNTGTHFTGVNVAPIVITAATTAYTIDPKKTGCVFLIPDVTAETLTFTLPDASPGLSFEFIYTGAAADAAGWVINTAATDELFKGGLVHLDTDAGSAADEVVPVFADGSDDDSLSVPVPAAGTRVLLVSDGSHWYISGSSVSASAPVFS